MENLRIMVLTVVWPPDRGQAGMPVLLRQREDWLDIHGHVV
jgi:hypothetical protein